MWNADLGKSRPRIINRSIKLERYVKAKPVPDEFSQGSDGSSDSRPYHEPEWVSLQFVEPGLYSGSDGSREDNAPESL